MRSRVVVLRFLSTVALLSAIAPLPALASEGVRGTTAWPQGRGIPRSVRPLVFNVHGRVERLLLLDVGPVSEPVTSMQLDPVSNPTRRGPKIETYGTPAAIDVRVLVQTQWFSIVEIVPWAGRPLPARRKFRIVDPEFDPAERVGTASVVGEFETGDGYEEERASVGTVRLTKADPYRPLFVDSACNFGTAFFSFDLEPASKDRRVFAVWLLDDSPGVPPSALVLSRKPRSPIQSECLRVEQSRSIQTGQ